MHRTFGYTPDENQRSGSARASAVAQCRERGLPLPRTKSACEEETVLRCESRMPPKLVRPPLPRFNGHVPNRAGRRAPILEGRYRSNEQPARTQMSCHVVEKTRQNSFRNMLKVLSHAVITSNSIASPSAPSRRNRPGVISAVKRRFGIVRHSARRSFKDRSLPSMPNDSCPAITKSQTNPPPAQPRSRCKIGFLPNASSQARTKRGCLVLSFLVPRGNLAVITFESRPGDPFAAAHLDSAHTATDQARSEYRGPCRRS